MSSKTALDINAAMRPVDISNFECVSNQNDIRHDLYHYMQYVSNKEIKRSHRENLLPKNDLKRLARSFKNSQNLLKEFEENGEVFWIAFVDNLALKMRLVDYDTKGTYAGWSSREPTYPDNYIKVNQKNHASFLKRPPREQELEIKKALVENASYDKNEFFESRVLGRLDQFDWHGCATGVNKELDFASPRKYLLACLERLVPGKWYRTNSLIDFVKNTSPCFLIPAGLQRHKDGKYGNYREKETQDNSHWYGKNVCIRSKDEDGFERVEGRYMERFLEGIPLEMDYVELAYSKRGIGPAKIRPSRGKLKAFKVKETPFGSQVKVAVNSNFEVHVQTPFFPISIIHQLSTFCRPLRVDRSIILKIDRKIAMQNMAINHNLDPIRRLEALVDGEIPPNIRTELDEQRNSSDSVVLFDNCSLLELENMNDFSADVEKHKHLLETISSKMMIVSDPKKLFSKFEKRESVPLLYTHEEDSFMQLASEASTVFFKKGRVKYKGKEKERKKEKIVIKREEYVAISSNKENFFEGLEVEILKLGLPVIKDSRSKSVLYPKRLDSTVKKLLSDIQGRDEYQIV